MTIKVETCRPDLVLFAFALSFIKYGTDCTLFCFKSVVPSHFEIRQKHYITILTFYRTILSYHRLPWLLVPFNCFFHRHLIYITSYFSSFIFGTLQTDSARSSSSYKPQVEAISPTLPAEDAHGNQIRHSIDELVAHIQRVERDIQSNTNNVEKAKKKLVSCDIASFVFAGLLIYNFFFCEVDSCTFCEWNLATISCTDKIFTSQLENTKYNL